MKSIKELSELSKSHPYYCSDSSYYSLGFNTTFSNWEEFYVGMGKSDLDMNLVFRWDVCQGDDGNYCMEIFIIHQRKGRFVPFMIDRVTDEDVPKILEYLKERQDHIKKLWNL